MIKRIYCISDIHGCLEALLESLSYIEDDLVNEEVKLIFLGDYVHGPDSYGVLKKIRELEDSLGERCIVLMGNHESMCIEGRWPISGDRSGNYYDDDELEEEYLSWMLNLPLFYVEEGLPYIFTHAGIEEGEDEKSVSLGNGLQTNLHF